MTRLTSGSSLVEVFWAMLASVSCGGKIVALSQAHRSFLQAFDP